MYKLLQRLSSSDNLPPSFLSSLEGAPRPPASAKAGLNRNLRFPELCTVLTHAIECTRCPAKHPSRQNDL